MSQSKRPDAPTQDRPGLFITPNYQFLALTYFEHLGAAYGADTLCCRPAVLHGDSLGILHFSLGTTFHTIALHWVTSLFPAE